MILVFGSIVLTGQQVIGEFGIGPAMALLIDAFILRTILVPALMQVSGRANWWLPGWLDKALPHVSVERPSHSDEPESHDDSEFVSRAPVALRRS